MSATTVATTTSGNADIDGILSTGHWATTSLTFEISNPVYLGYDDSGAAVSYLFSSAPEFADTTKWDLLTAAQEAGYRDGLAQLQQFSALAFTEVTESTTVHGDLRVMQSFKTSTASTFEPTSGGVSAATGDTLLDITRDAGGDDGGTGPLGFASADRAGTWGHSSILHELGHAVGLKHGTGTLPSAHDGQDWSIMTYRGHPAQSLPGYSANVLPGNHAQSYMRNDIQAIQYLYGANFGAGSNNTASVYTFSTTTGQMSINGAAQGSVPAANIVYRTIWDGGGEDTYDFSNYSTGLNVDLAPGAATTLGMQRADLGYTRDIVSAPDAVGAYVATGNIFNAWQYGSDTRSLIENVIGGSGNDSLKGNAADNDLTGGAGNDTITGGSGGFDRAILNVARSGFTLTDTTSFPAQWYQGSSSQGSDWIEISSVDRFAFTDGDYSAAKVLAGTTTADAKVANFSAAHNSLTGMAAITDIDGGAASITQYHLWTPDDSAVFIVGGARQHGNVGILVSDLSTVQIDAGSAGTHANLYIRAKNASGWGAWDDFTLTSTTNAAPVVTPVSGTITATIAQMDVSDMFTVADANGDAITAYRWFQDATAHGYGVLDGERLAVNTTVELTPEEYGRLKFFADPNYTGSDSFYVMANDGGSWSSSWAHVVANETAANTAGNSKPVTTLANLAPGHGAVSLSPSNSDANGDTISQYRLWDNGNGNGHLEFNGVALGTNQILTFTAAELSQVKFVGGGPSADQLYIMGFDGKEWQASWDAFTITQPANGVSTLTAPASSSHAIGSSPVAVTSIWTFPADPDGDTFSKFSFWDDGVGAVSGHFVVDGVNQTEGAWIEVQAADLANTFFEAGLVAGTEHLYARAWDGEAWTAGKMSDWITI